MTAVNQIPLPFFSPGVGYYKDPPYLAISINLDKFQVMS